MMVFRYVIFEKLKCRIIPDFAKVLTSTYNTQSSLFSGEKHKSNSDKLLIDTDGIPVDMSAEISSVHGAIDILVP